MNKFSIRVTPWSKLITPKLVMIPIAIGATISGIEFLLYKFLLFGNFNHVLAIVVILEIIFISSIIFISRSRGYQVYSALHQYLAKNFVDAEISFMFDNNQLVITFKHKLLNELIEVSDKLQDKLSTVVQHEYIGQKRSPKGVTYYFDEMSNDYSKRRFGKHLLDEIHQQNIISTVNVCLQSFQLSYEIGNIYEKDEYIYFSHIIPKNKLENLKSELEFNKTEYAEILQVSLWSASASKKIPILKIVDMRIEDNRFNIVLKEDLDNGNDTSVIPSPNYLDFL